MKKIISENTSLTFKENGKINVPSNTKHIKIDIGLSYNAPQSQLWLSKEDNLIVFGFESHPECFKSIKQGSNKRDPSHGDPLDIKYVDKQMFIIPCALSLTNNNVTTSNDPGYNKHIVPCFTLKSFFDIFPFEEYPLIEYIKVDGQGSNLNIIKSGEDYIKNNVAIVTLETDTFNSENEITKYMESINFEKINSYKTSDATFVNKKFKHLNIYYEKINFSYILYSNPHDMEIMAKCGEVLDAILYINLSHRKDRKDHILNEIKKINPSLDRVHRIDALYVPKQGALGASMSHIKALELMIKHPEWKKCAIFEDDFTFSPNASTGLNALISCTEFDVLLLAVGTMAYDEIGNPHIIRVLSSQTASGYIVHRNYLEVLLENFYTGFNLLLWGARPGDACVDMYWKRLMPDSRWYTTRNQIGYQYANFSDIEKGFRDYGC